MIEGKRHVQWELLGQDIPQGVRHRNACHSGPRSVREGRGSRTREHWSAGESAICPSRIRQGAIDDRNFSNSHHQSIALTPALDFTVAVRYSPPIASMAAKRPARCLFWTASSSLRPTKSSKARLVRTSACTFSTSSSSRALARETEAMEAPRWQKTPPRMRAPFRIRPQAPGGVFAVNEDPRKLDEVYIRMLGPGGDKMLGDEAKWLAVTHKSFDHGRMGFNDRLAYLGMSEPTNVTNEANRHQGDG
jgi:hypothetical protein